MKILWFEGSQAKSGGGEGAEFTLLVYGWIIVDVEAPRACRIPCKLLNIVGKEKRRINRSFDTYDCSALRTEKEIYQREKQEKSAEGAIWGTMRDR